MLSKNPHANKIITRKRKPAQWRVMVRCLAVMGLLYQVNHMRGKALCLAY